MKTKEQIDCELHRRLREATEMVTDAQRAKDYKLASYWEGLAEAYQTALSIVEYFMNGRKKPRNCDVYPTVREAGIAFAKRRNNPHPCPDFTFSAWLYAEYESEVKA